LSAAEPRARDGERGIALLMVLWVFMVLTVLVAEFSRSMRDDAVAAQNVAEEVQARGVAIAGMNTAIYRTLKMREQHGDDDATAIDEEDEEERWLPDGTWHNGQYGAGTYAVRMIDEGGKISLDKPDEALLRRIFQNLGLDQDSQEALTDAILDWRDKDSLRRLHGAEDEYYLKKPVPYRAKNGPFDSVDELLLVRGVTRELFFGTPPVGGLGRDEGPPPVPLKEIFSVFNRTGNINVRYAPAAVLRVLLSGGNGEDVDADVEEVIAARSSDPGSALTLLRAKVGDPLARRLVERKAHTIAIDVRAAMQTGQVQARVGAVVEFGEDTEGFHIARWFDRLPAI
jgi:type II secretory pathway component PulK